MTVKIVLNRSAVRDLLRSPEVQADLLERAERIAAAAGEGFEPSSFVGRNRARASVITATADAMLEEAKNRTLTRALDAGRD